MNDKLVFFWEQVALDIKGLLKYGSPSDWKRGDIVEFLIDFENKLIERINQDTLLAKLFTLKVEDGKVDFAGFRIPSYDMIRRVFLKKEGKGSLYYRKQFVVFLGFDSIHSYIAAKSDSGFQYELPQLADYLIKQNYPSPYLGLQTYQLFDCDLFFGRNGEIRSLLEYLAFSKKSNQTNTVNKDLVLLYGQTGVGKSSFLSAGLIPRFLDKWDVSYHRRNKQLSLSKTFELASSKRPVLILFDQIDHLIEKNSSNTLGEIEEIYTSIKENNSYYSTASVSVIISLRPQSLENLQELLQKSNLGFKIKICPQDKTESDLKYVDRILKLSIKSSNYILLISSLGEKHNLWQNIYRQNTNQFFLRYGYGEKITSISASYSELTNKRRKLIILDQLEEAITKPNNIDYQFSKLTEDNPEIRDLAKQIAAFLKKFSDYKIILSFRADYLAEIEDILDKELVNRYKKWLIKPLNETSIQEAIEGPLESNYFDLRYYDGFVKDLIDVLKTDEQSNIAPALQIILKKLWHLVKKDTRFIDKIIFDQYVRKEKRIIESFIQEQITTLNQRHI